MSTTGIRPEVAVDTLTRGQWQAHIGSELFGDYYEMLTEQSPPKMFWLSRERSPEDALIHLGRKSAQVMVYDSKGTPAEEYLVAHGDELLRYTDVESMRYANDESLHEAVRRHASDGLQFAHAMTMGMVVATAHAAGLARTRREYYGAAAAVLHNPRSESILKTLALTGFDVIGSDAAPYVGQGAASALRGLIERLGYIGMVPPIELRQKMKTAAGLAEADIRLNPSITQALQESLAGVNSEIKHGTGYMPYPVQSRHAGRPGFSSGCPVAHNDYTFATMRAYLGECARLTAAAAD